jgi:hypothetical protein
MADNTAQNATDTIATDDVTTLNGGASSGVKVQRVKVGYGADGSFTDASSASPLPVVQAGSIPAGTNTIGNVNVTYLDTTATGTITAASGFAAISGNTPTTTSAAANSTVTVTQAGNGTALVMLTGTFVATLVFEFSPDGGTTWLPCNGVASVTGAQSASATAPGAWRINSGGYRVVRVRSSAYTSGTVTVTFTASGTAPMVTAAEPLPILAGGNFAQLDATGTPVAFQSYIVNISTATTTTVASAVAGKSYRVINYAFVSLAAQQITFGGAPFNVAATGGIAFTGTTLGPAFQLAANTALSIVTNTATTLGGHVNYVIV